MKYRIGLTAGILLLLAAMVPAEVEAGHRHGYGYHGHSSFSIGFYGYPYYGPYYRPYVHPYAFGPYRYGTYYPGPGAGAGALDLNVKPKKAEVFIDGQYVGLVRNFDGWPSYLWLPKGTYEITFHHPGYGNIVREFTVYPGIVLDVKARMEPGEGLRPEKPAARDERPARRSAETRTGPEPIAPKAGETTVRELSADPGRLQLRVTPGDASVYLDGRFLGRGGELANLSAGLIVEPGEHLLEIVRPGHQPASRRFVARSGEEVKLEITLVAGRV